MKVLNITAEETRLLIKTTCTVETLTARAYSPATGEQVLIGESTVTAENGVISVPRIIGGRDGLYLRWEVECGGQILEGKKYTEDLCFPVEYDYDYPQTDSKKGLQVTMIQDAIDLGVRHAAQNICIGDIMRPAGSCADPILFTHDGVEYTFDREYIEKYDKRIKELSDNGMIVTLILLNSKHWATPTSPELYETLFHPGFTPYMNEPDVHLSAFNVTTDIGIRYYCAFAAFLAHRYARPDGKYGRAVGMIISNEINSQWIWGNAGHKTVEEYMTEYTIAMRLAWQAACSVYRNARIYISLDHFWTGAQNLTDTTKYYGSRPVLENLSRIAGAEGDFYWNVAHHPYPQNLALPDFWNDETAENNNDTYRITFKNLRVLADFLYREENLYRGKRRRIILSEQGFNSHFTPESEVLQACAYGRAYRICMEIPEIDSFILHAHTDNWKEFGLNLGLWRREKDGPKIEAPKPIYYVFKAIDKKDESGKYHWERY